MSLISILNAYKTRNDIGKRYCPQCNCLRPERYKQFLWKKYTICPYCHSIFTLLPNDFKINHYYPASSYWGQNFS